MIWIALGVLIIAALFAGLFVVMACALGWKTALGIWAGVLTVTAMIGGAVLLIGYGVEGHL